MNFIKIISYRKWERFILKVPCAQKDNKIPKLMNPQQLFRGVKNVILKNNERSFTFESF